MRCDISRIQKVAVTLKVEYPGVVRILLLSHSTPSVIFLLSQPTLIRAFRSPLRLSLKLFLSLIQNLTSFFGFGLSYHS